MALVLAVFTASTINAQTKQTANEGFVGYSFVRQDVKFTQAPRFVFNENTDSHGFNISGTHYFGGNATKVGVVGLTADFGANFDSNEANLVTATAGVTIKGRNFRYIQPSVRVLGGIGRQHVNRRNILDTTDVSGVFIAGVGLDFTTKNISRYKFHTGIDYLNTGFGGERQNGARATVGLTF